MKTYNFAIVLTFDTSVLYCKHTHIGADLCCEGYLLGEYMLPSLLEGPMLF